MRRFILAGLLCLAAFPADAGRTVIPVSVPGFAITIVLVINDQNVVGGTAIDSANRELGFLGPLGGPYRTFALDGTSVQVRGIDANGNATAVNYRADGVCGIEQVVVAPDGTVTPIRKRDREIAGFAGHYNARGQFAGSYCRKDGTVASYIGRDARYRKDLAIAAEGYAEIRPLSLDSAGTAVGYAVDAAGNHKGFVFANGATRVIAFPNPEETDTLLFGINDKGIAVGNWYKRNSDPHVFLFDTATGTFDQVSIPGKRDSAQATDINDDGLIAVNSALGAFIYCPRAPDQCPAGGIAIPDDPAAVER